MEFKDLCTNENYNQFIDLAIYDDLNSLYNLSMTDTKDLITFNKDDFNHIGQGNLIAYYVGNPSLYKKIYTNNEDETKVYLYLKSNVELTDTDIDHLMDKIEHSKNSFIIRTILVDKEIIEPYMFILFVE